MHQDHLLFKVQSILESFFDAPRSFAVQGAEPTSDFLTDSLQDSLSPNSNDEMRGLRLYL